MQLVVCKPKKMQPFQTALPFGPPSKCQIRSSSKGESLLVITNAAQSQNPPNAKHVNSNIRLPKKTFPKHPVLLTQNENPSNHAETGGVSAFSTFFATMSYQ